MGRGRLLRTIKKEAYWVAKAKRKGELQAEIEAWSNKPFDMRLWELLKPLMEKIDPLEIVAILGGTYVCHDVIFKAPDFKTLVAALTLSPAPIVMEIWKLVLGQDAARDLIQQVTHQTPEQFAPGILPTGEIMPWLISFGISYFVFRHGGNLLGTAKMFFGGLK